MFGPACTIYVYRSYGIHWCLNIVTGVANDPQAVLIRGGEILDGRETVIERRGRNDHLTDGPGKIAQALAVDGSVSGSRLGEGSLNIIELPAVKPRFETTARIGISAGTEKLWRFVTTTTKDERRNTYDEGRKA